MTKDRTEFEYTFRNTAKDFFDFNYGNVWHSWTAVVNLIFVAAFIALAYFRWTLAGTFGRSLIVLGILMFPVIQPLVIWLRADRMAKSMNTANVDTRLCFDETGLTIHVKEHRQHIDWAHFAGAIKRPTQLVVLPDAEHAYLLNNKWMGDEKDELYAYIQKHAKGRR